AQAIARLRRLHPDDTAARGLVMGSVAAIVGFLIGGGTQFNFAGPGGGLGAWAATALPYAATRAARPRGRPAPAPPPGPPGRRAGWARRGAAPARRRRSRASERCTARSRSAP